MTRVWIGVGVNYKLGSDLALLSVLGSHSYSRDGGGANAGRIEAHLIVRVRVEVRVGVKS